MRAALALALALGCTSCSSTEAPAGQPAPAQTQAQAQAQAQKTFSGSRAEVEAHLASAILPCPAQVSVRVTDGLDKAFCERACDILNRLTGAWCYHYSARGDELAIDIRYTDYALMLAVHEGRIPASRLSPAQAEAYGLARRIVAEARAAHADDYGLALALHDTIVLRARYRDKVSPEGHASGLLLQGEGLCECYAGCYYLLARMAGLQCLYVEGTTKGTGHVWNLVRLGGQWVHVDCTYDDPTPDRQGKALRHYFGMDDATIAKSHRWDRRNYPACPDDSLWYPKAHIPRFATVDAMAAALLAQASEPGGKDSLEGYVEEVARQPQRAAALLRTAVDKYRRSMSLEQGSDRATAGFITLSLRSGTRPGAGR